MPSSHESSRYLQLGVCLAIALGVFTAVWLTRTLGVLQGIELRAYDVLLNDYAPKVDPPSNVVVVGINDEDIQRLKHYPPSDYQMSRILKKLLEMDAKVIAVDIFRDLPEPDPDFPHGSEELQTVIRQNKQILWVMEFKKGVDLEIQIHPPEFLRKRPSRVGYSDQTVDSDGRVRRAQLVLISPAQVPYFSLNFQSSMAYLVARDIPIDIEVGYAIFGKTRIDFFKKNDGGYIDAQADGDQILVDFKGPKDFAPISAVDILEGKVSRDKIAGKVVMFGYTAHSSVKDIQQIPIWDTRRSSSEKNLVAETLPSTNPSSQPASQPLSQSTSQPSSQAATQPSLQAASQPTASLQNESSPPGFSFSRFIASFSDPDASKKTERWGIQVHAIMVDQIIRAAEQGDVPAKVWPNRWEAGYILLWCILAGVTGFFLRGLWLSTLSLVLGLSGIVASAYFAFGLGWWIPVIPPLIAYFVSGSSVAAYLKYLERAERAVLMQLFSRHVSEDIAKAIWENREQIMDTGGIQSRSMQATVLFTDAVGFSTTAEKMEAQEVFNWLNNYMEVMSGKVMEHKGIIDKYIGDSIMAVFGVPFPGKDRNDFSRDAKNAIRCALTMRKTLLILNTDFTRRNMPNIGMRVGIHSGKVASGSLGSKHRLEFATIGDTVNTASRLESFDKELMDADIAANNCRILISQATLELTDGEFNTRFIGNLHLKGKAETVNIYGVIGYADGRN